MTALRVPMFALAGLIFGSFLTVVVSRTPRKVSVVAPASACPRCGAHIRMRDNLPVISYVLLRGRCRDCDAHISAEYPIVESLAASLAVGAALAFHSTWVAALTAPFLGVMIAAGLIDIRHRIIPNRLTYPALIISGVLILAAAGAGADVSPIGAALGLAAYGGGLLIVAVAAPHAMGMGDVKLATLIGLVLGALSLRYVAVAAVFGILAGGVGGLVALLAGRGKKDTMPFGPYLAGGAIAATFISNTVVAWYAGLLR